MRDQPPPPPSPPPHSSLLALEVVGNTALDPGESDSGGGWDDDLDFEGFDVQDMPSTECLSTSEPPLSPPPPPPPPPCQPTLNADHSSLSEESRLAKETRIQSGEEARMAEEVRLTEEARLQLEEAHLRAKEEARLEEEFRLQAIKQAKEEARLAEEVRLAKEARLREEEEAKLTEQARLRVEEETRSAEEARLTEETQLRAEEDARLTGEARLDVEARLPSEEEAILSRDAHFAKEARLAEEWAKGAPLDAETEVDGWDSDGLDVADLDAWDGDELDLADLDSAEKNVDNRNISAETTDNAGLEPGQNDSGGGWDDDLDFDDFESQDETATELASSLAPLQTHLKTELDSTVSQGIKISNDENGWGDEDLNFDDFDDLGKTEPTYDSKQRMAIVDKRTREDYEDNKGSCSNNDASAGLDFKDTPASLKGNQEDWAFGNKIPVSVSSKNGSESRHDDLTQSLLSYLKSLPHLLPSLNAILEAEHSTVHRAMELCKYYESRSHMREYTLETELPRMQYEVVLDDGILREKEEVKEYLYSLPDSVLIRCANQSLLPDVLAVLTGLDSFVQPQYMATAIAQSCQFTLQPPDNVFCRSRLHLSLPDESGSRLDVASLDVTIRFDTNSPALDYSLGDVEYLLPLEPSQFECTARFLSSMDEATQMMLSEENAEDSPSSSDAFRDTFMTQLTHTHRFVEATNTGLASALKQIDAVANVSQKIGFFKKASGGLMPALPSSTEILEGEGARFRQGNPPPAKFDMTQTQSSLPVGAHTPSTLPIADNPPPPPPPPRSQDSGFEERPRPIIGGLLMSGLSRLAQTVSLPEENPDMYRIEQRNNSEQHYLHQQRQRDEIPSSRTIDPRFPAKTSKKIMPAEPTEASFRQDVSQPMGENETRQNLPIYERKAEDDDDEEVSGGWDDDDLDLDMGLDEDTFEDTPLPDEPSLNHSEPVSQSVPQLYRTEGPPVQPEEELKTDINQPPLPLSNPHVVTPTEMLPNQILVPVRPPSPNMRPDPSDLPQNQISVIEYNDEDDIIETRSRWINPRYETNQIQV